MDHSLSPRADRTVRVLLVDREQAICAAAAQSLATCFPMEPLVVSAASGRAAVELLRAGGFDLLFADLGSLRDLADPEEAMGRLIRLAGDALAIAVADAESVTTAVAAMRAGAHDFMAKPIGGPLLAARLGALAQRHGRRLAVSGEVAIHATTGIASPSGTGTGTQVLPMWLEEQRIIEAAVATFAGNVALAAAALELSPSTIYRKRQAWAEMAERRGAA